MIQDNITFNNVAFQTYAAVNDILSRDSAAKINAGKGRPIVNAVSIDWNGAEVDENKVINTTGQLLAWIKEGLAAAAQSGGQVLTEEQLETFNTATNLLGFISDYALRTSDADTRYTLKSLFDTTIAEIRETIMTPTAVNAIIDDKGYQTEDQVNAKIQAIVGAAPEALDTLQEIAAKLGDNDDAVAALTSTIANKANTVDVYTKTDADTKFATKTDLQSIDVSSQLTNYATKQSVNELISEVDEANETTAEALVQLQEQISNISIVAGEKGDKGDTGEAGPQGEKGDTGEAGPKGDKGDTGTFDSSALAGYVTIEQYNGLLARVAALEAQIGGDEPVVDNTYITPTKAKPTSESIAEMQFPSQKPTEGLTLETSEITRPTEVYLVYPTSWVTANNDNDIINPVITDHNGYEMGVIKDSIVTVDGVSYTIMIAELGQDTYTITFS